MLQTSDFDGQLMDSNEVIELTEIGFAGFITVKELYANKGLIPAQKGVYCILRPEGEYEFLELGYGGYFKGKNPMLTFIF